MARSPDPYYVWRVVTDPSHTYTGPFRTIDVELTAEVGYWPEGIIFEHKRTGQRKTVKDGQLISLTPLPQSLTQETLR